MSELSVEKSILLPQGPAWAYQALTTPDQILQYFPLTSAIVDPQPGGEITLHGETETGSFADYGRVLHAVSPSRFCYRYWSTNHGTERRPENEQVIDYRILPTETGCQLTVVHSRLPSGERQEQMLAVWDFLLQKLRQFAESV